MGRKVYILPRFVQYVKSYFDEHDVEIIEGPQDTLDDLMKHSLECDAIVVALGPICREYLEAAKNLKVAAKLGVGVDNIDCKAAEELGIWVGFAPQSNSLSVAEITLAAIFNMSRKYSRFIDATFANNWQKRLPELLGQEIEGKTLAVFGLGRIGQIVARKASLGLGMRVLGFDAYADPKNIPDCVEMMTDIKQILNLADYVTVHTPLTDETRGMFNEQTFAMMKPGAYFINMARGPITDESALYNALKNGQIAGASVDAFCIEPPDMTNPLFTLPNFYPTPHKASHTIDAQRRMAEHAAMNIVAVLDGKEPVWPVNRPACPRPL